MSKPSIARRLRHAVKSRSMAGDRATRLAFEPLEPRKLLFGDPVFDIGTLDGQNGFAIPAIANGGRLGLSVTAIGDLNVDGIDDFAVSAPAADGSLQEGRIYVIFGAADLGGSGQIDLSALDGNNGFVIAGVEVFGQAGWSLAELGDVNNDGHDDLVIGAPFLNAAYVVFGSTSVGIGGLLSLGSLDGSNGFKIDGDPDGDAVGFSVAGAGDVNDDGYNDILLGSPLSMSDAGVAYVVFGGDGLGASGTLSVTDLNGTNGLIIRGLSADDEFGWRVSSAGDLNDDGIDDFAIGELQGSGNSAGAVYVIFGAAGIGQPTFGLIDITALDGSNGFKINGLSTNDFFSTSISGRGDVNGDGVHDLLVGSLIQNTYVLFGTSGIGAGGTFDLASLDGSNGYVAFLPSGVAAFVAHAGDLNDDGIGDVAIGSAGTNEVFVFIGGADVGSAGVFNVSTVDGENGFVIQGVRLDSGFIGEPISRGKDVNDDGLFDLLIGAAAHNNNDGAAYVLFGITITGLSAPTNLTATALDQMAIELEWEDTTLFEDGFEIERSLDGVSGWTMIAQAPPSSGTGGVLTYQDGNLDPNTRYYYRVRAYNQAAQSAYSNTADATTLVVPDAPTDLQAMTQSESVIRLTWTDASSNEDGFNIYQTDGEVAMLVGTVGANTTTFDDTGLLPGTTYYYFIRAFNDQGESGDSNFAFATTDGGSVTIPDAPSALTAVAISQSEIQLNWVDSSNNEEGFIIERATDPNLLWFQIDTVLPNQTQYVNMGLPADSTYFYRVRAFNSAGNSEASNVAGATTSMSEGGGRSVQIVDGDGDIVTFSLIGVGGTISYTTFGDGGGIDTLYVAANQLSAGSLVVSVVRSMGGDGRVRVGRMQGDIASGDLFVRVATVNLGVVDFVGEGAWMCNVNRAVLGDLTGSASIQGQVANLSVRDVSTTGGILLCDVSSFHARSLDLGGGFEARSIANFVVDGDADLRLTTTSESGLGTLRIGGHATLELDVHRAGQINILGNARFTGASEIADRLTRLKIGGSWLSGSLTVGHLVTKIEIIGDVQTSATLNSAGGCIVVCGDSSGTFNLDHFARFIVKGDLVGGSVSITDSSAGIICIKGDFAAGTIATDTAGLWCLKICGSMGNSAQFDSGGRLQKGVIRGSLDGMMEVDSTDCIVVCEDFTGSFVANGTEGNAVRKFCVKGVADSSRFASVGDVNCVIFGKMEQVEVYVGLATNWSGGLPSTLGEFVQESVLRKLQVRGDTRGATIAASSIANLCLRDISDENTFHLAAGHVERAKLIVENQSYNLGFDEIFTDLPMLGYLDILQLFES